MMNHVADNVFLDIDSADDYAMLLMVYYLKLILQIMLSLMICHLTLILQMMMPCH